MADRRRVVRCACCGSGMCVLMVCVVGMHEVGMCVLAEALGVLVEGR